MSPPIILVVGVLLAVAIAGEFFGAALLDRTSSSALRLTAARADLDALVRRQLADEAGVRGYVATGKRSFLEQRDAAVTFEELAARLRAELVDLRITGAPADLDELTALHSRWRSDVEQPLLESPRRHDALARQTEGKRLSDGMRHLGDQLRREVRAAETEVARKLGKRIQAVVGASSGTILLFALAIMLLGRSRSAAVAALAHEQSLVAALQQTLRVDSLRLPSTEIGFAYASATREALVGGDLLDTWPAGPAAGWVLIADVSGKGIAAARYSAFVQYALRTLCADATEPGAVLARFNALFLETFDDPATFVVALLGRLDTRTGELRYASAGHAIAFVMRDGRVEQLAPTGPILGLDAADVFADTGVPLRAGDMLVLATDGLTESRDAAGAMLGEEGVMRLLAAANDPPQALCDRLAAEVRRRGRGRVTDDLAILAVRLGSPTEPAAQVAFSTVHA